MGWGGRTEKTWKIVGMCLLTLVYKCILAMGTTADLGPPEVEFNFPLVLYRLVCIVRWGACVVSIELKPLWLAGAADMASSHNGGFILPTVKRLRGVKVRLCGLVGYDDPQCKPLPEAHVPAVL